MDSKGAVKGAVFESKSGRQAILADVVIDATGDGDIYAAAGAAFEKIKDTIGLDSRMGNVSVKDMLNEHMKNAIGPRDGASKGMPARGMPVRSFRGQVGSPTPAPGVNWINMNGPPGFFNSAFSVFVSAGILSVILSISGFTLLLLMSITSGSLWCARICPLGATQDYLAYAVGPIKKVKKTTGKADTREKAGAKDSYPVTRRTLFAIAAGMALGL